MNLKTSTFLTIISLIILNACSKQTADPDYITTGLQAPVITGYVVRDEQGFIVRYVGEPNIENQILNESSNGIIAGIVAYPNPAAYVMAFHITNYLPASFKFYLVRGTVEGGFETAGNFLGSASIVAGVRHLVEIDSITADNNIQIDVGKLPDGYYRAYLEGDNVLLWDNIVIQHDYNPYQ